MAYKWTDRWHLGNRQPPTPPPPPHIEIETLLERTVRSVCIFGAIMLLYRAVQGLVLPSVGCNLALDIRRSRSKRVKNLLQYRTKERLVILWWIRVKVNKRRALHMLFSKLQVFVMVSQIQLAFIFTEFLKTLMQVCLLQNNLECVFNGRLTVVRHAFAVPPNESLLSTSSNFEWYKIRHESVFSDHFWRHWN